MKKFILFLMAVTMLSILPSHAQSNKASFPGGKYALTRYVREHQKLNHLKKLKNRYPTAKVLMEFTVNVDGRISDLKKINSPHSGFTDEAARILRGMPHWIPARSNGRAIKSRARHTFYFNLRDYKFGNYTRSASYPGGTRALDAYYRKSMNISKLRSKLGHRFRYAEVVMEFDVDTDGVVKNLKKISSPHSGFTDEAVRATRRMKNWYPAYKNGVKVKTRQRYTVKFDLR